MTYLRLLGRSLALSLCREVSFTTNLVAAVLAESIGIASGWITILLVTARTDDLAGWQAHELVVLLGQFTIMASLIDTFVTPNLQWFSNRITAGQLDDLLLRPVPSLYLATLEHASPLRLLRFLLGAIALVTGLVRGADAFGVIDACAWLVTSVAGLGILWALRTLVAAIAFWRPGLQMDVAYNALWESSRYPAAIYGGTIRRTVIYALPLAIGSSVSAGQLVHGAEVRMVCWAIIACLICLIGIRCVWARGIAQYESASS